ncbi:MAG: hypothetical protein Q8L26_09360 [Candidatus Omnitrophota bacterium]|nr:hypothetical protein [Candidatus Omnitrophota bacterium]
MLKRISLIFFCLLLIVSVRLNAETIWVADKGVKQLLRVNPDGRREIIKLKDFLEPQHIRVYQHDGSVWVTDIADIFNHQIIKLSSEGEELFRLSSFIQLGDTASDPNDGSFYVVSGMTGAVIKVSSKGEELFRIRGLYPPDELKRNNCFNKIQGCHQAYTGANVNFESIDAVAVSPIDSSIWVTDTGQLRLLKFNKDGVKLAQKRGVGLPEHLAVGLDGSCWVNNIESGKIFKVSSDGKTVLAKITGLDKPIELQISPLDNTCWTTTRTEVLQISSDGLAILKRVSGFKSLQGISNINPKDGSFWVADAALSEVVKISKDGIIIKRINGFKRPRFIDVYWGN